MCACVCVCACVCGSLYDYDNINRSIKLSQLEYHAVGRETCLSHTSVTLNAPNIHCIVVLL